MRIHSHTMKSWCLVIFTVAAVYFSYSYGVPFKGCGVPPSFSKRNESTRGWPWMVALLRDGGRHYCGGALITRSHVLTAAHCLEPFKKEDIMARVGEYDLDQNSETRHADYRLSGWEIHEKYDSATYENDIAVITLRRPVTFNILVNPICLPPEDVDFKNQTATVIGWGTLFYGGPSSNVLMEVDIPVWNTQDCAERFTQPVLETNLCAAAYEGGKDSCQGDSGGPLMFYDAEKDHWMTIGIVSWGIMCGEPMKPGVYTRVNRYLQWITEKTAS